MNVGRALKLNDVDTVRFIKLYQNERLLYDTTLSEYRNRDLRAAASERIANELNVPGFGAIEVIVKFKNLRNAYSQELKKIVESKKDSTSPDQVYTPRVCWFNIMDSFIRPFVLQRAQANTSLPVADRYDNEAYGTSEESRDAEVTPYPSRKEYYTPEVSLPGTSNESYIQKDTHSTSEHFKKRKLFVHDYYSDENSLTCIIRKLQDILESVKTMDSKTEDSYELFGRYIASLLRELEPPEAVKMQQEFIGMVYKKMKK